MSARVIVLTSSPYHLTTFEQARFQNKQILAVKMSCPLLNDLTQLPFNNLLEALRLAFPEGDLDFHLSNILENHSDDVQVQLGQLLYYQLGTQLASQHEWNQMTFLQLEHEAQIQGLIGANHGQSEWQLRLMLEIDARTAMLEEQALLKQAGYPGDKAGESEGDEGNDDARVRLMFCSDSGYNTD